MFCDGALERKHSFLFYFIWSVGIAIMNMILANLYFTFVIMKIAIRTDHFISPFFDTFLAKSSRRSLTMLLRRTIFYWIKYYWGSQNTEFWTLFAFPCIIRSQHCMPIKCTEFWHSITQSTERKTNPSDYLTIILFNNNIFLFIHGDCTYNIWILVDNSFETF